MPAFACLSLFSFFLGALHLTNIVWYSSNSMSQSCIYSSGGGLEGYTGGGPADCPANAAVIDTCGPQKKRTLSKLETKIRERQWKGPNRL